MQRFGLKTVHHHGRKLYDKHRERLHCTLLGILGLFVLIIAGQMFFPYGRILPGVSIDGHTVGTMTVHEAAKQVEKRYDNATVTLQAAEHTTMARAKYIGIEVVPEPTAELAAHYTLIERLIPFSFLMKMNKDIEPILRFDDVRLREFAEEAAKKGNTAPKNASITVTGDSVALQSAAPGRVYSTSDTMHRLHQIDLQRRTTIALIAQVQQPMRTDKSVRPVLAAAQRVVDATLTLQVSDEKIIVDKKTLASWIDFKEAQNGATLELVTKPDAVKAYLTDLQARINRTPGTTAITLVDGQTVSRTDGVAGFGVDVDKSAAMIAERLPGVQSTMSLPLVSLPATVVYSRSYTDTQKGLDTLVRDVSAMKGGASIVVLERGGQNRDARIDGGRVWPAASMYKIYVAYAVLKQIDAGKLQWDDTISYGKNTSACFEAMIVISDNVCAAAFLDKLGRGTIQDIVRAAGLTGTTFTNGNYTTANDLALFLTKLEDESLLAGSNRATLLDAMKRQIYKAGIPLGARAVSANKVGYVWGVRHDAGIVYSAKGTYIEVIMTGGLEWPSIADAARQIGTFMDR